MNVKVVPNDIFKCGAERVMGGLITNYSINEKHTCVLVDMNIVIAECRQETFSEKWRTTKTRNVRRWFVHSVDLQNSTLLVSLA